MARTKKKGRADAWAPVQTHLMLEVPPAPTPRRVRAADPKNRAKEEARQQKRWVAWARTRGLNFNHQNNGANTKARRIHLHQMGCTSGAADVIVFDVLPYDPPARGLALEFKAPGETLSPNPRGWREMAEAMGWRYHVVHSADAAKEICRRYGLGLGSSDDSPST